MAGAGARPAWQIDLVRRLAARGLDLAYPLRGSSTPLERLLECQPPLTLSTSHHAAGPAPPALLTQPAATTRTCHKRTALAQLA